MAVWTLTLAALMVAMETAHAAPMSCAELLEMVEHGFPDPAILAAFEDLETSFSPSDAMCASESGAVSPAILSELANRVEPGAATNAVEAVANIADSGGHHTLPAGAQVAQTSEGIQVVLLSDGTWYAASAPPAWGADMGAPAAPPGPAAALFRGMPWGSPPSTIKSKESSKLETESADGIVYSGEVAGLTCIFGFNFIDNQLVFGKYVITESHTNKNGYIQDFRSLKEGLTLKYGQPIEENVYWQNDLYRDDYSNWGMAISVGHLSMFTKWIVGDTEILLGITGDNFDISLSVDYYSIELRDLRRSAAEKKSTEGL
jgi:hypothetical protein